MRCRKCFGTACVNEFPEGDATEHRSLKEYSLQAINSHSVVVVGPMCVVGLVHLKVRLRMPEIYVDNPTE